LGKQELRTPTEIPSNYPVAQSRVKLKYANSLGVKKGRIIRTSYFLEMSKKSEGIEFSVIVGVICI
jgi:hypothetical protein